MVIINLPGFENHIRYIVYVQRENNKKMAKYHRTVKGKSKTDNKIKAAIGSNRQKTPNSQKSAEDFTCIYLPVHAMRCSILEFRITRQNELTCNRYLQPTQRTHTHIYIRIYTCVRQWAPVITGKVNRIASHSWPRQVEAEKIQIPTCRRMQACALSMRCVRLRYSCEW